MAEYLRKHPECEVYDEQDRGGTALGPPGLPKAAPKAVPVSVPNVNSSANQRKSANQKTTPLGASGMDIHDGSLGAELGRDAMHNFTGNFMFKGRKFNGLEEAIHAVQHTYAGQPSQSVLSKPADVTHAPELTT